MFVPCHYGKSEFRFVIGAYVDAGRLIGDRSVGDYRPVEGFCQNVFRVLADERLTGSELNERVERMNVGDRTRQTEFVFDVRHGRVVHEFERR